MNLSGVAMRIYWIVPLCNYVQPEHSSFQVFFKRLFHIAYSAFNFISNDNQILICGTSCTSLLKSLENHFSFWAIVNLVVHFS